MKTIILNKIKLAVTVSLCIFAIMFVACGKDDVSSGVELTAFGPSPALRGGQIKFIGTNLDKITSVVFANNVEVKDITKTSATEISIAVPQEAMPGVLTLKSASGNIITKTPLTFSEPISISDFAPASVKAGDVLTINGEYLNLIANVTFSNGVVVDSAKFVSKSRKKITLKVPEEAKTGKFFVATGGEIPIQVFSATLLAVTLPTITSLLPSPVKPGTSVQINGINLQLVKSLVFYNGTDDGLIVNDFTVNATNTVITASVPATVKEGKLKLFTKSAVYVESPSDMTLIGPAITAVAPVPAKNGGTLTITGTDLDLVTKITFPGDVEGTIGAKSATSLEVTVPLTATEGSVLLSSNSGKTAQSAAITYVKPTITSITPLSLMAGGDITINGTDLDLVTKVTFVGGLSVDVKNATANSFVVTVPSACVGTGSIKLTTTNGGEVISSDQLSIEAANKPVIINITASVKPGKMLTITGTKLNLVESIYFKDNNNQDLKAVLYGVRTETSIEVYVPETSKRGKVALTMKAFDGAEVVSPQFNISGTDPVVDPSLVIFDFEDVNGNNSANNAGGWGGIANGKSTAGDGVSGDFFEITAANWNAGAYWWVADNWIEKPYPIISGINNYVIKMDIRLRQDIPFDSQVQIKLRISGNKEINFIPYLPVVDNKFSTGGDWVTITIPTTDLTDPTVDSGDWGIVSGWNPNALNFTGFCVDNIRYERNSSSSSVFGLY